MPWIITIIGGALIIFMILKREKKVVHQKTHSTLRLPPLEMKNVPAADSDEDKMPEANYHFALKSEWLKMDESDDLISDFEEVFLVPRESLNIIAVENEFGELLGEVPTEISGAIQRHFEKGNRILSFAVLNRQAGQRVVRIYTEVY